MSCGGSQRGDDRNEEDGPDGWAVAGDFVPRAPPKAGDLLPFGNITIGSPMTLVMSPSSVFGISKEDSKQETHSHINSSLNMLHTFSNSESAAEASTKPSRSLSRKQSIDLGHDGAPELAVQHRELQLADESMAPLEDECESAFISMSEADIKKEINKYVSAFFAVRNLEEADVYVTKHPRELCFRFVDNRQIPMSCGGPRGGSKQEHGPDAWAAPCGSIPWAPPKADDLSQFGKISMGAPMVVSPSSAFAGTKMDSKLEAPSQPNSSSNMCQNHELPPEMSTKPNHSLRPKLDVDLGHAGVPETIVQRKKIQLLPRSILATEENAMNPSEEESENASHSVSKTTLKKIDEDVKEFFMVRNLQEADDYFPDIPCEHRFRLVDKLVASALESKETDAKLVGDFFAQAMSNGHCALEIFEKGFMPMAEFLDDIAIDAPRAFDYMAIMLQGAGMHNEPERLHRIASKLKDSAKLASLVASN
jgi:hypothetical protein